MNDPGVQQSPCLRSAHLKEGGRHGFRRSQRGQRQECSLKFGTVTGASLIVMFGLLAGPACTRRETLATFCASDPASEPAHFSAEPVGGVGSSTAVRAAISRSRRCLLEDPAHAELVTERKARMAEAREAVLLYEAQEETSYRMYLWIFAGDDAVTVFWRSSNRTRVWTLDRLNWDVLRRNVLASDPWRTTSFADARQLHPSSYFVQLCLDGRHAEFAYAASTEFWLEGKTPMMTAGSDDENERAIIKAIGEVLRWAPL